MKAIGQLAQFRRASADSSTDAWRQPGVIITWTPRLLLRTLLSVYRAAGLDALANHLYLAARVRPRLHRCTHPSNGHPAELWPPARSSQGLEPHHDYQQRAEQRTTPGDCRDSAYGDELRPSKQNTAHPQLLR